jgi:hypothetical protein
VADYKKTLVLCPRNSPTYCLAAIQTIASSQSKRSKGNKKKNPCNLMNQNRKTYAYLEYTDRVDQALCLTSKTPPASATHRKQNQSITIQTKTT